MREKVTKKRRSAGWEMDLHFRFPVREFDLELVVLLRLAQGASHALCLSKGHMLPAQKNTFMSRRTETPVHQQRKKEQQKD